MRSLAELFERERFRHQKLFVGDVIAGREERLREQLEAQRRADGEIDPSLETEFLPIEIAEQISAPEGRSV